MFGESRICGGFLTLWWSSFRTGFVFDVVREVFSRRSFIRYGRFGMVTGVV